MPHDHFSRKSLQSPNSENNPSPCEIHARDWCNAVELDYFPCETELDEPFQGEFTASR